MSKGGTEVRINLGDRVRCKYTGVYGTATQRVQYLGRSQDQIGVQADSSSENGTLPSLEYIQENWLEIVDARPAKGIIPK